ncbi:MAG: hypothetical protein KJ000_19475 [Pirellulaceae bacterium]|nr:hypothetical protein [Pirellulaceae bacterium]
MADLLDEVGLKGKQDEYKGRHCPSCNAPLAHNAVLCVGCGLNLETGKFTKGFGVAPTKAAAKKAEGHEGAAERLLTKAQDALVQEKVEQVKNVTEGMPTWAIAAVLTVIGTIAVSMSTMPQGRAFALSGWVCITVCMAVSTVFSLRIAVIAFQESAVNGLMYLFVPFYALFYVFTRWSQCGRFFMTTLAAALMALVGVGLLFLATLFTEEASSPAACLPPFRPIESVERFGQRLGMYHRLFDVGSNPVPVLASLAARDTACRTALARDLGRCLASGDNSTRIDSRTHEGVHA